MFFFAGKYYHVDCMLFFLSGFEYRYNVAVCLQLHIISTVGVFYELVRNFALEFNSAVIALHI